MPKKTKEETKVSKPKKNINVKKMVKRFVAKPVAYVSLFVSASYGIRTALNTLEETAAFVITGLLVLALVYVLFDE